MYTGLFTADWHLSNRLPHSKVVSGADGITDRLLEQIEVIQQVKQAAIDEGVDCIYILGDIFDKRSLDAIVLKAGARLILGMIEEVPAVRIMTGNHDVYSITSDRSVNEVFDFVGHGHAQYVEPGNVIDIPGQQARLHFLPWCSLDVAAERLKKMASDNKRVDALNVLLLHHSVQGARDQNWVSTDGLIPEKLDRDWDHILSGHFHDYQTFGEKGLCVSAPMQHDFGDGDDGLHGNDGLRGYCIAHFDKGKCEIEFKQTEHARFHSMQYSTFILSPLEYRSNWRKDDFVRFDVIATHAEWKLLKPEVAETEKGLIESGLRVIPARFTPQNQHSDRIELADSASTTEILSKYLDVTSYDGLDRKRLLEIANHALSEVENG